MCIGISGIRHWFGTNSTLGKSIKREKKKKLLVRMDGINRVIASRSNRKLEDLQKRLWSDYEKVLIQEELI